MGRVWEAEKDGSRVALKVFACGKDASDFLLTRFRAEAPLVARLNHPGIVRVRDWGVDAETQAPYFAMDLILTAHGEPETLERARRSGDLSLARLTRWYHELAAALAYLHEQGIVHRDVKLENVLLDEADHAVLTDFGVARVFDADLRRELHIDTTFVEGMTTGTCPVMGTYWYIPPEVRAGAPASPASDRYALGVLFFRLLTGVWYEPPEKGVSESSEVAQLKTEPLELLAPFPSFWRTALTPLLTGRVAEGVSCPKAVLKRWGQLFKLMLAAVVLGSLGLGAWLMRGTQSARVAARGPVDGQVVNRCLTVSKSAQVWGKIDCGMVTSLVVRGTMKKIRPNLFENWTNLVTVVFEEGVETIGVSSFNACKSLERVVFPDSLKQLFGYSFGHCDRLREVRFGQNFSFIGKLAFSNCDNLRDLYFAGLPPQGEIERLFKGKSDEVTVHVRPTAVGWPEKWPAGEFGRTVKRDWRGEDVP